MDEPGLAPASPWAGLLRPRVSPGSTVILQPVMTMRMASLSLRANQSAGFANAVRAAWGFAPPPINRRAAGGGLALVSTSPHTWLATSGAIEDFGTSLREVLGDYASITDQSDARAVIRVSGPGARAVLAKILPIDLHPGVFGAGSAATTVAGQIGVTIWQLDARPSYELAVSRSSAGSFARWLTASAEPVGLDVVTG